MHDEAMKKNKGACFFLSYPLAKDGKVYYSQHRSMNVRIYESQQYVLNTHILWLVKFQTHKIVEILNSRSKSQNESKRRPEKAYQIVYSDYRVNR